MISTSISIQLDYDKAIRQADELDSCVERIQAQKRELEHIRQQVVSAWQGENAKVFVKKISILEQSLVASEKKLQRIAYAVRNMAKKTYEAETRAIEIAKERVY